MTIEAKLDRIIELIEGALQQPKEEEPQVEEAPAPARRGKGKKTVEVPKPEHSIDDIRTLAITVSKKVSEGKEKTIALLSRYGCKKLTELQPDQQDPFYDQLKEVQEGDFDPRDSDVEEEEDF